MEPPILHNHLRAEARRQIATGKTDRAAFMLVLHQCGERWTQAEEDRLWREFEPSMREAIAYFRRQKS